MAEAKHFSDDTLKSTLNDMKTPILLAFFAPWSNACKVLDSVMRELASDYGKRLQIGLMNVDENAHAPAEYGVTNVPHFVLFNATGEVVNQLSGPHPKTKIIEMLDKNLV